MPMIDVTYTTGALDDHARDRLTERLTSALLRAEGAPETPLTRALTWIFLHELPPGSVAYAGATPARPLYRVMITVPAGTFLHGPGPIGSEARESLIREATEIVLEAGGSESSPHEAARVYCIVTEVADGYWGGMGRPFHVRDIAALANEQLPQTPLAGEARPVLEEVANEVTGALAGN